MSIQSKTYTSKKTGKTYKKYFAIVYDPVTQKHIWSPGFSKERDAKAYEPKLAAKVFKHESPTTKMSFEQMATEWKEEAALTLANSTYQGYVWYLDHYIMPVFKEIRADKITAAHVQKFKTAMAQKYAAETVNKTLNIMSDIFQFGVSPLQAIGANPCDGIKRIHVKPGVTNVWDADQIRYFLFLPETQNSPYYDMLLLSLLCGMRPSEVCGLSDSDLVNCSLTLHRSLDRYGTLSYFMKNHSSIRRIELPDWVYDRLCSRRDQNKITREEFGTDTIDNDFLFLGWKSGQKVLPSTYSKAFHRLLKQHNERMKKLEEKNGKLPVCDRYLPPMRLYDCRHSMATNMLIDGTIPVKVISEIMGHSSTKMVQNRYAHLKPTMHKQAIMDYSSEIFEQPTQTPLS